MRGFLEGFRDVFRAQRLLFKEGLWPLFLIPGILSLLYLPLSVIFGVIFLKDFTDHVHDRWIPEFLQSPLTSLLLMIFLAVAGFYLGYLLFRNVIMILYSPILSFLSEATERVAAGNRRQEDAPGFSVKEVLRSARRGTSLSLLTLLLSLLGLVTSFLIAFVPVVGAVLATVFMPLLTGFLAGVGFYDPALERRGMRMGEAFSFCWRHRGRVTGVGFGFTLLLMLPVVGWFLAPSFGVVGGTLGAVDLCRKKS